MGRIRAIGHRRALIGVIAVAALALAGCMRTNPPRQPAPTAAFSVSIAPLVASFTDQSTGTIDTRSWDFGDGATSTEQSPTHPYATHGDYVVTLTLTGPGGTDTETQTVTIKPPAPVASFTAEPPSGTVPLTVFLSSTSTGIVDSIAWDLDADGVFGDATGPTATQTFTTAGDHTVGMSVTGPGGTSMVTKPISVALPPPPVASFTAFPTSGVAPLTVTFTDTSSGDIASRSWDFNGDGIADATGATASHAFDTPGSYPVALTVTGPWGGLSTTTQAITVNVPPPVAAFNAAPSTGTAPLTVQLNDTSSGAITSRAWTIGNESVAGPGVPLSFTWVFDEAGTYTATLTVNGPGGTDTASKQITVTAPNAAPSVMISSPESGASFQALTNVTFTGSAMDAEDGNLSSSIHWSSSRDGALGTGASISSTLSAGVHMITASVTDGGGKTASTSISVTITGPAQTTTTTTTPHPPGGDPPGDGPGDCGGRRCVPRDPGDGPPDQL